MLSKDLSTPKSRRVQGDELLSLMGVSGACPALSSYFPHMFLLSHLFLFAPPTNKRPFLSVRWLMVNVMF